MTAGRLVVAAAFLILSITLSGCEQDANVTAPAPAVVGADRDEHGCIGSAGYAWCAAEAECVRSWELAQEKGFAGTAEAFEAYCSGSAP